MHALHQSHRWTLRAGAERAARNKGTIAGISARNEYRISDGANSLLLLLLQLQQLLLGMIAVNPSEALMPQSL